MEPDARANELYWESDRSVNQIADELELSKGTLYGMIRPLPAERSCPRCSSPMEYANRTARERGLIVCRSCGLELTEESARRAPRVVAETVPEPPADPQPAPPRAVARLRGADPVMLGAGLLLLATGIWLFRGLNRR